MESRPMLMEARFTVDVGCKGFAFELARKKAEQIFLDVRGKQGYSCVSKIWMRGPFPCWKYSEGDGVVREGATPGKEDYVLQAYWTNKKPFSLANIKKELGLWLPSHRN